MDELDRQIVRTWSALTTRNIDATAEELARWLSLPVGDVERRVRAMRATQQIPWVSSGA
jgi:hypothetical protein